MYHCNFTVFTLSISITLSLQNNYFCEAVGCGRKKTFPSSQFYVGAFVGTNHRSLSQLRMTAAITVWANVLTNHMNGSFPFLLKLRLRLHNSHRVRQRSKSIPQNSNSKQQSLISSTLLFCFSTSIRTQTHKIHTHKHRNESRSWRLRLSRTSSIQHIIRKWERRKAFVLEDVTRGKLVGLDDLSLSTKRKGSGNDGTFRWW